VVAPIVITIADQIELIQRHTERGRAIRFRQLLERAASRLEIIVTLLALLELIKQLRVTVRQDRLFDDILIVGREAAKP
jgi:segregation and condensation protein A